MSFVPIPKRPDAVTNPEVHKNGLADAGESERLLAEQQWQTTLAMDGGKMGFWRWDLDANSITWTESLEAIHGQAPGSFDGTLHSYESDIHPEDLEHVRSQIQRALKTGRLEMEYRIRWPDHSVHWLISHGTLLKNEQGRPTQLVGLCQDITERKQAEQNLALSEARIRALFESALDAVIELDREGRIREFNPAAEQMLGYRREDVVGGPLDELILPASVREKFSLELQLLAAGRRNSPTRLADTTVRRADGSEFAAEMALACVQTALGPLFNAYLRDVSEQRQVEEELKSRLRQQSSLVDLAKMVASGVSLPSILDRAVFLVARDLGVEYAKALELQPDGRFFRVVAGVGWKEGVVGQALIDANLDTQAGYTILSKSPVIVDDLAREMRFRGHQLLWAHGVKGSMTVIIPGRDGPWGILGAHTAKRWRFTQYDLHFLNGVALILGHAVVQQQIEVERRALLEQERIARIRAEQALFEREAALQVQQDMEKRLNSLVQVSTDMITSMEVGKVLDVVRGLATDLVNADAFAVWRHDDTAKCWRMVSGHGLSANYPRQTENSDMDKLSEPMVLEDLRDESLIPRGRLAVLAAEGVASLLVMPLKIKGENTGTLTFYFRTPHHFSEVEIRLVTALANLASSGITVSELYAEEANQRRRADMAGLGAKFMGEVTTILSSSLDYRASLDQLGRLLVPFLSDWCYISESDAGGQPSAVSIVHRDPKKISLASELLGQVPRDNILSATIRKSLETGSPVLISEIDDEALAQATSNQKQVKALRSLGLRSLMVLPLQARGRLLGTITLATAESGRRLEMEDLVFAQEVAGRAAIAVDNGRLYKQAQDAQAELQLANEAKDEFLGMLSHELRSPITVIYGGARILKSRADRMDAKTREDIVADIEQEAERLYRVVEDLLALARVELGRPVDVVPIQAARWLEKVVNSFRQRRHGRDISIDCEADLPLAVGEQIYLEQVLRNLLSNADKYSPVETPISVQVYRDGDELVFTVLDRGPGIDEGEANLIFERFYRSEHTSRKARGAGIGLTVCRRLIEAQSGRIWAEQREGGGLKVSFALPIYTEEFDDDKRTDGAGS